MTPMQFFLWQERASTTSGSSPTSVKPENRIPGSNPDISGSPAGRNQHRPDSNLSDSNRISISTHLKPNTGSTIIRVLTNSSGSNRIIPGSNFKHYFIIFTRIIFFQQPDLENWSGSAGPISLILISKSGSVYRPQEAKKGTAVYKCKFYHFL